MAECFQEVQGLSEQLTSVQNAGEQQRNEISNMRNVASLRHQDITISLGAILAQGHQNMEQLIAIQTQQHEIISRLTTPVLSVEGVEECGVAGWELLNSSLLQTEGFPRPDSRPWSTSTLNVILQHRWSGCLAGCTCYCHLRPKERFRWKSFPLFRHLMGSLFIGYSAYPANSITCNSQSCLAKSRFCFDITYTLPEWFLRYAVYAVFEISAMGNPSFGLTARPTVPYETGSIMETANRGDVELMKQLLSRERMSINRVDLNSAHIALHSAVNAANVELIRILLQGGAGSNVKNDLLYPAAALAVAATVVLSRSFSPEMLEKLEDLFPFSKMIEEFEFSYVHKVGMGIVPLDLSQIIKTRDTAFLRQLNMQDGLGWTPLHWAARRDDLDAVQKLLPARPPIDARSSACITPLMLAALWSTKATCVKALIDAGANVSLWSAVGWQPLHYACSTRRLSAIKLLLSAGADVNSRTGVNKAVPLSVAAKADCVPVMQCLLDGGADIDCADEHGNTPLFYSVMYKSHENLRFLLDQKANYTHVDKLGRTVLHLIAMTGDIETMNILATSPLTGLDRSAIDKEGFTAYQMIQQRDWVPEGLLGAFDALLQAIDAGNCIEEDVFYDAFEMIEVG
jgi:ankyrin repeat protein